MTKTLLPVDAVHWVKNLNPKDLIAYRWFLKTKFVVSKFFYINNPIYNAMILVVYVRNKYFHIRIWMERNNLKCLTFSGYSVFVSVVLIALINLIVLC